MSEPVKPPRGAFRVLNLFSSDPLFPQIAGDMSEEFHQRVHDGGEKTARLWYWRELLRNLGILILRQVQMQHVAFHAMMQANRRHHAQGIVAAVLCVVLFRLGTRISEYWLPSGISLPMRLMAFIFLAVLVGLILGIAVTRPRNSEAGIMRRAFTAACLLLLAPSILIPLQSGNLPSFWPPPGWSFHAVVIVFFWIGSVLVERRSVQRSAA